MPCIIPGMKWKRQQNHFVFSAILGFLDIFPLILSVITKNKYTVTKWNARYGAIHFIIKLEI